MSDSLIRKVPLIKITSIVVPKPGRERTFSGELKILHPLFTVKRVKAKHLHHTAVQFLGEGKSISESILALLHNVGHQVADSVAQKCRRGHNTHIFVKVAVPVCQCDVQSLFGGKGSARVSVSFI
jgi:hypothetical protein